MKYRALGRTGIKVSPYCLGAMMFGAVGGNPDHDDSIRIIHKALDAGINFIDTADRYSQGESEEIVGKALKGRQRVGSVEGLEAGFYHFSPADLKLRGLRPGDWRATLVPADCDAHLNPKGTRRRADERDLLAQRLEVSGARLPILLLGRRNDSRQPDGRGAGRGNSHRNGHCVRGCGA